MAASGKALPVGSLHWRRGSLRRYESMGSLGAKFCIINGLTPANFVKMISHMAHGWPNRQGYFSTILEPDFPVAEFAKLLDEPMEIVQSMTGDGFMPGHAIAEYAFSRYRSGQRCEVVRVCPKCMANGFHSVVHQVEMFTCCIFHGDRLETPDEAAGSFVGWQLPSDLQDIPGLLRLYTQAGGRFQLRRELLHGDGPIVPRKVAIAQSIINASAKAPEILQLTRWCDGETGGRVAIWSEDSHRVAARVIDEAGEGGEWLKFVAPLTRSSLEFDIMASKAEVDKMMRLTWKSKERWERDAHRKLTCHLDGLMPEWQSTLDGHFHELIRGHERCVRALGRTLVALDDTQREPLLASPAYSLRTMGFDICPCLVALDMLAHAFSPMPGQLLALKTSMRYHPWPSWCSGEGKNRWVSGFSLGHRFFADLWPVTWSHNGYTYPAGYSAAGFFLKEQTPSMAAVVDACIEAEMVAAAIAAGEAMQSLELSGNPTTRWRDAIWQDFHARVRELCPVATMRSSVVGLNLKFDLPMRYSAPRRLTATAEHRERSLNALQAVLQTYGHATNPAEHDCEWFGLDGDLGIVGTHPG